MKRKIKPFFFSDDDLRAIAQASSHCPHGCTRLVWLMQQIHRFRDGNSDDGLAPGEADYFRRLAARLEIDVALALYLCLLESGWLTDGFLDLEALAQTCPTKIAH